MRADLVKRIGAIAGAILLLWTPAEARAQEQPPLVAAAANMQVALNEVRARFRADTGADVRLSFGSSGNIVTQIKAGAPYQLFLSADEAYVRELARSGHARDEGVIYAIGRLALFVPNGGTLAPDGTLDDLAAALAAGRIRRFAIANPELAPYGRAAMQVLKRKDLWDKLAGKLVLGENISQTAQFASSGAAEGGLIALSLTVTGELQKLGRHSVIPAEWHDPLRQRMVLTRLAGVVAERFFAYLQEPAARAILARYGFSLPGATD